MFNPLVGNLSDLTDEELSKKVDEIQNKLGQASRAGMFSSVHQMNVVLYEYHAEMNTRHLKRLEEHKESYDELIDVNKNV